MTEREACRRPEKTTDRTGPVWKRLEAEREYLFRGLAVIDACRLACRSMPTEAHPESFRDSLHVAYDIIDWATAEIEMIAGDAEEQARAIARAIAGVEVAKD
jgi:hypothetical protein